MLHDTGDRGVQLFFALSGFLICTRLLREESTRGAISLRSFYLRRLVRIQPAALAYLLVIALLGLAGLIAKYWPGIAGAILMVRNLWPSPTVPGYWYTLHFWSLSVEEHFYLLLPGFLVLCRRRRLILLSLAAIALELWRIFILHRSPDITSTVFFNFRTDMVLGGILLGSVFAVALDKPHLRLIAERLLKPWVAVAYTAMVFLSPLVRQPLLAHAFLITVYPLLIAATVLHPSSITGRLLEFAPIRFVGRISYSLYLWQQLFSNRHEVPAPGSFQSYRLLCAAAALLCALASYYLIEVPALRLGHRLIQQRGRPHPHQPPMSQSIA